MGIRPVTEDDGIDIAICDGCGKQRVDTDLIGIAGEVTETTNELLSVSAEYWACTRRCLGPATRNALDAAWEDYKAL